MVETTIRPEKVLLIVWALLSARPSAAFITRKRLSRMLSSAKAVKLERRNAIISPYNRISFITAFYGK